jgi:hypothetical protein
VQDACSRRTLLRRAVRSRHRRGLPALPRRIGQQHDELIPSLARGGVPFSQHILETGRNGLKQVVAVAVPDVIVNQLEVIEVDERDAKAA